MKCLKDISSILMMRWAFNCLFKSIVNKSNALLTKMWFWVKFRQDESIYSILASWLKIRISAFAKHRFEWLSSLATQLLMIKRFDFTNEDSFDVVISYENLSLMYSKKFEIMRSHERREIEILLLLVVACLHFFCSWFDDWHIAQTCL